MFSSPLPTSLPWQLAPALAALWFCHPSRAPNHFGGWPQPEWSPTAHSSPPTGVRDLNPPLGSTPRVWWHSRAGASSSHLSTGELASAGLELWLPPDPGRCSWQAKAQGSFLCHLFSFSSLNQLISWHCLCFTQGWELTEGMISSGASPGARLLRSYWLPGSSVAAITTNSSNDDGDDDDDVCL